MRRSKKLDRIHTLLIIIFSIICITGTVFFCYDKCVVAYICWCVCILIVPCAGVLNFEYRSAIWEEFFNEKIKNKEQSYETQN